MYSRFSFFSSISFFEAEIKNRKYNNIAVQKGRDCNSSFDLFFALQQVKYTYIENTQPLPWENMFYDRSTNSAVFCAHCTTVKVFQTPLLFYSTQIITALIQGS